MEPVDERNEEHRARVLLVEDDEEIRTPLSELLLERGYDVCPAEDGQVAVEKLRTSDGFDVVVTDLRMPRLNGVQLLEILRDERPELSSRTIVISGYATPEVPLPPHFVLLRKPVSSDDLVDAIRACAGRQRPHCDS